MTSSTSNCGKLPRFPHRPTAVARHHRGPHGLRHQRAADKHPAAHRQGFRRGTSGHWDEEAEFMASTRNCRRDGRRRLPDVFAVATFRARHGRGYQTPHRCYHFVRRWRRGLESMHWPHVQPQGYVVGKVNPSWAARLAPWRASRATHRTSSPLYPRPACDASWARRPVGESIRSSVQVMLCAYANGWFCFAGDSAS